MPSILRNSFFLYVRLFITLLISLYSSRVLLNVLGVEDFGIYNVVAGFVSLAMFFRNTLVDAIQRYLTIAVGKKDIQEFNNIYCTSLNINGVLSVILLILFFSVGIWFVLTQLVYPVEKTSDVLWVYSSSCISFILGILSSTYIAAIVAYERMDAYAYIGIISAMLKLGAILLLNYCFDNGKELIIYSILILAVAFIETIIQYLFLRFVTAGTKYRFYFDKVLFRSMLGFSGWNTISSGAILLISQGGNILLNLFGGPIVNAANGIAYQVMGAVRQFSSSFQNATNPRITKYYAQEEIDKMLDLCLIASKGSFLVFFLICVPLSLHIDFVLQLWLVDVPEYASLFCILVLSTALFEAIGYPIITAIRAVGNLKGYQVWVSSILIMALPISYILLKYGFPLYIVYVVNLFLTIIASLTRIIYLHKLINFNIRLFLISLYKPIFYVIIVTVPICMGVIAIIPHLPLLTIPLIGLITLSFIFYIGLTSQERIKIFSGWKNLKGKKIVC